MLTSKENTERILRIENHTIMEKASEIKSLVKKKKLFSYFLYK
jgi:hypothetical protein